MIFMLRSLHYCLKVYQLESILFLIISRRFLISAPKLVGQSVLKNRKVKLELLPNTYTLLMVEQGIIGGICHTIHSYVKTNK